MALVIDDEGRWIADRNPMTFCCGSERQFKSSFECVDVFEFDANGLVERMIIVYDT